MPPSDFGALSQSCLLAKPVAASIICYDEGCSMRLTARTLPTWRCDRQDSLPSSKIHHIKRTLSQSCLLAKPIAASIICYDEGGRPLLASIWHFCSHSGCQRRPQSHLLGFTWVGININRTMKVIANVLIRYDDNIVSKRMNGKNVSNLTNRW